MREMKVWDLPTRIFHWAMAVLVLTSWISGENGYFTVHLYSGLTLLTLVIFRILWGFFGSDTSRWRAIIAAPGRVMDYARRFFSRGSDEYVGHNPLGGVSVIALVLLLAAQVGTGLFAQDIDFIMAGPLTDLVAFDTGRLFAEIHHIIFGVFMSLVLVHVAVVLFYLFYKKRNLIRAMITGWQKFSDDGPATPPTLVPWFRGVAVAAIAIGLAMVIVNLPAIL